MDMINQLLGTMDQRLLIGLIIFLVIMLVISLIKKLIKLAVFIVALVLVCTFVLPVAKEYQEKYNFRIENDSAVITVEGKDVRINKDTCQGIRLNGKSEETGDYSISIIIDGASYDFEVPKFIESGLEAFANKSDIKVEK